MSITSISGEPRNRYLNGPLIPGDVLGPRYREQIEKIEAAREARLLTAGEYAGALKLAGEMLSWGRFWEQANTMRVAELLRCTTKWASKMLVKLSKLGLIGWLSKRGNGARSFLGLAPELMPLQEERTNQPALFGLPDSEDSKPLAVEETVHNVSQSSREESVSPDTVVLPDTVGTAEEEHLWDAEIATDETVSKLFHGKHCPREVKEGILRRFLDVRTGKIPSVLTVILSGPRGSKNIAYPFSYAMTCIGRAEEQCGLLPKQEQAA
jgi:hypothetical protein